MQAEIASNTYVVSGDSDTKKLEELLPKILPQLGPEHLVNLKVITIYYTFFFSLCVLFLNYFGFFVCVYMFCVCVHVCVFDPV